MTRVRRETTFCLKALESGLDCVFVCCVTLWVLYSNVKSKGNDEVFFKIIFLFLFFPVNIVDDI